MFTHLLGSMSANLDGYLDMNRYYSGDEFEKQAELLVREIAATS